MSQPSRRLVSDEILCQPRTSPPGASDRAENGLQHRAFNRPQGAGVIRLPRQPCFDAPEYASADGALDHFPLRSVQATRSGLPGTEACADPA